MKLRATWSMTGNKQDFRRQVRGMCPSVQEEQVIEHILAHPWFLEAERIMAYAAIPPEIDLTPVIEAVFRAGKTLILPRCESEGQMTARKISDLQELMSGAYGILEPRQDTKLVPAQEIDLILVPGLAFDQQGRRLGRGKGYYDRFLRETTGKKMGICSCLLPEIPVEEHDIAMDAVATEDRMIICEMEEHP